MWSYNLNFFGGGIDWLVHEIQYMMKIDKQISVYFTMYIGQ